MRPFITMRCGGKRTSSQYSYTCSVPTKWQVSISDKCLSKYQYQSCKSPSSRLPQRLHNNCILTTGKRTGQTRRQRPPDVPAPSDCADNPVGSIRVAAAVFLLLRQSLGGGQRSLSWQNYKRWEHSGETLHKLYVTRHHSVAHIYM